MIVWLLLAIVNVVSRGSDDVVEVIDCIDENLIFLTRVLNFQFPQ